MNQTQQMMADIFNEWSRRYAENPDEFGEILDADGRPVEDYGHRCVLYFESIASEMDTNFIGAVAPEVGIMSLPDELKHDTVNNPKHYTSHPSGVECIQITEHMGFNLGNAMKYIWRADLKAAAVEDLKKARWYIERELRKRGMAL